LHRTRPGNGAVCRKGDRKKSHGIHLGLIGKRSATQETEKEILSEWSLFCEKRKIGSLCPKWG